MAAGSRQSLSAAQQLGFSFKKSCSFRTTITATVAPAEVLAAKPVNPSKPTLFDVPVSNNGARVRYTIYKKGLESEFDIKTPKELGGLSSPEYRSLNPQGKMPLLVLPDGTALPESQVIESYILDKYHGVGPELLPATAELRARAALVVRILDLYITPVQGCMYKKMDAQQRLQQLAQIAFQLDVLENLVEGPFVTGSEVSYADAALFPTFVFFNWMLPSKFGWSGVFIGRPKLEAWWNAISADADAQRVIQEIQDGLKSWEAAKRWDTLGITQQVSDGSYNWSCS